MAYACGPIAALRSCRPSGGIRRLALPAEEQELHRRANRVAKVSMQDIKMLRPNDVTVGQRTERLVHSFTR